MSDASNALVHASKNGLAALDKSMLLEGNDEIDNEISGMGGGGTILKYSGNTGVFSFKDETFEHGSRFAFRLFGVEKGYVCWKDGKLIERALVPIYSSAQRPTLADLPDFGPYTKQGDGWSEAYRVMVVNLEDGSEYEFTVSNRSGCNAMGALVKDFHGKARMTLDQDGNLKTPVVEINARSFESKKFSGKKYAPEFKIVDWLSSEDMRMVVGGHEAADAGPDDDGAEDAAPETAASGTVTKPGRRARLA